MAGDSTAATDLAAAPALTGPAAGLLNGASARTLILGIDSAGVVLQHDRGSAEVLGGPDGLLGADLGRLITGPGDGAATLRGLIAAAAASRESTAVVTLAAAGQGSLEAIVTAQPVRSVDQRLAAQLILRVPAARSARFVDPAFMRHVLLEGAVRRTGGALDLDEMAPELVNILVPHFCNAAGLLVPESLVGDDEQPEHVPPGGLLVRRLAVAYDDGDETWDAAFPAGEILRYPADSLYTRCLDTRRPVCEVVSEAAADGLAAAWQRGPVAGLLAGTTMLLLPLIAGDTLLGLFVCCRKPGYRRFDAYDIEIGRDFASRVAVFMDTARRYSRERATALTLQRSMLPAGLSYPSSVQVRHRYLPGSKLIEVGGDWYESIGLPGGRVALVVGDVAGHGVRAAVTMGRLRTAIRTLAMLELSPAETLQRLDELMHELGVREPHFATCVFAVYDAVEGTCEVASAGHLPPLLVRPDGRNELLDVSPAPPLGIGNSPIVSRELRIEDGSLLVLYTDGLVEKRTQDIDVGLRELRAVFGPGSASKPLDELCQAALSGVYGDHQRDDIAVLIARLRRIPASQHVTWQLAAKLTSARRSRALIRGPLRRWGLTELMPLTELVVSELVTNAVRYAQGRIRLRLIKEGGLVCEVFDDSAALPRLRHPGDDDERGRGLQVVSQLAQRWGARRTSSGKVVWCELPMPQSAGRRPPAPQSG